MSFARTLIYECAENLLSFARFNCVDFNYLTGNLDIVIPSARR